MTPTYDNPLQVNRAFPASTDFAAQADITVGAKVQIPGGVLETHQILSVRGVVGTPGTGTLTFGTTAAPSRFGTFTVKPGLAAGAAIVGELKLTEEGYRIGAAEPLESIVIGFDGTLVATNMAITAGFFY